MNEDVKNVEDVKKVVREHSTHMISVTRDGTSWNSLSCKRGMTILQWITVTPDIAKKWLSERNTHNRPIYPKSVEKIAYEMKSGNYFDTANYVSFYSDGVLHDGQHRLSAIVKSGCPLEMWVVFGVLPAAAFVTDTNKPRNLLDRSTLAGHRPTTPKHLQAAKFFQEMISSTKTPCEREIIASLERYSYEFDTVCSIVTSFPGNKQPALSGFAYCLIAYPDRYNEIVKFASNYNSGLEFKAKDCPIYRLHTFALNGTQKSNYGPWRSELFLKTVWAVRQYLDGKSVSSLRSAPLDTIGYDNSGLYLR